MKTEENPISRCQISREGYRTEHSSKSKGNVLRGHFPETCAFAFDLALRSLPLITLPSWLIMVTKRKPAITRGGNEKGLNVHADPLLPFWKKSFLGHGKWEIEKCINFIPGKTRLEVWFSPCFGRMPLEVGVFNFLLSRLDGVSTGEWENILLIH